MSETPFEAQRRKLRELKTKQDAGEAAAPDNHISAKARARRNAEAASRFQERTTPHPALRTHLPTSKKKAKKKASG